MQIAHHPSIYVLDTPGVLVPSIPDIETGLKLALAGIILLHIYIYIYFTNLLSVFIILY
jgi:ribosome biogenesis GTPase A